MRILSKSKSTLPSFQIKDYREGGNDKNRFVFSGSTNERAFKNIFCNGIYASLLERQTVLLQTNSTLYKMFVEAVDGYIAL